MLQGCQGQSHSDSDCSKCAQFTENSQEWKAAEGGKQKAESQDKSKKLRQERDDKSRVAGRGQRNQAYDEPMKKKKSCALDEDKGAEHW